MLELKTRLALVRIPIKTSQGWHLRTKLILAQCAVASTITVKCAETLVENKIKPILIVVTRGNQNQKGKAMELRTVGMVVGVWILEGGSVLEGAVMREGLHFLAAVTAIIIVILTETSPKSTALTILRITRLTRSRADTEAATRALVAAVVTLGIGTVKFVPTPKFLIEHMA